ncbi:hypothetical protein HYC85_029031 [Camellia sinensis]|uniref:Reverse transcriptase domain-containing protein n=1 Tax=Camellia sinensis TaxID=4442 RepID=A0A7J7FWT0_CAMSI|nr:hypothetical protein HYC85_029031 [Camellia sinensis]
MASKRQNRNLLNSISVGGELHEKPSRVKHEILLHFKKMFSEDWKFNSIGHDGSVQGLEAMFSEEVWEAIRSSDGNKAPGPDGINLPEVFVTRCFLDRNLLVVTPHPIGSLDCHRCYNRASISDKAES